MADGDTTKVFSRERGLLLEERAFFESFLPSWVYGQGFVCDLGEKIGVKSDVEGFTSLTERLTKLGDEGVDELAGKISDIYGCFDAFLKSCVVEYHEGDAVIATGNCDDVLGIVRAGVSAQQQIQELGSVFGDKLRMRLGLASGRFFRGVVGTDVRKIPVILGDGLKKSYNAEELSVPGRVCLDEFSAELFREVAESEGLDFDLRWESKKGSGVYVLDYLDKKVSEDTDVKFSLSSDSDKFSNEDLKKQIEYYKTFFPKFVLDNLSSKGAFRTPSILFAEFPSLKQFSEDNFRDKDALFDAYQSFAELFIPAVEGRGGVIDKFYDGKLIAYDLSESSRLHLLEAAHEINDQIKNSKVVKNLFSYKPKLLDYLPVVSFETGTIYLGPLGTKKRRTFTGIGKKFNEAARVMITDTVIKEKDLMNTKIKSTIPEVLKKNGTVIKGRLTGLYSMKGVSKKVPIYLYPNLDGEKVQTKVVGRAEEIKTLDSLVNTALTEESQVVHLVGPAGMGKTALTNYVIDNFKGDVLEAGCTEYSGNRPGFLMQELVRTYLNDKDFEKVVSEEFKPVLNHWLALGRDFAVPSGSSEDLEIARKNAVISLFKDYSGLLVLNDLHWADEESMNIIEQIQKSLPKNSVLLTNYRDTDIKKEYEAMLSGKKLLIKELDNDGVKGMIENKIGTVSKELTDFVFKHSKGVPLYVREVVNLLLEENKIKDGQLVGNVSEIKIPKDIKKIIEVRVSNLDDDEQVLLAFASAMYEESFDKQLVFSLAKKIVQDCSSLDNKLQHLVSKDFLTINKNSVSFKHHLIKESIYKSILNKTRNKLHAIIGNSKERIEEKTDTLRDSLAFHYSKAAGLSPDYLGKAFENYWSLALDKVQGKMYDFKLAEVYANELIALAEKHKDKLEKLDDNVLQFYPRIYLILSSIYRKDHNNKEHTFEKAIELTEKSIELSNLIKDETDRELTKRKSYLSLANINNCLGNFEEAKKTLKKGIESLEKNLLPEEIKNEGLGKFYSNLSKIPNLPVEEKLKYAEIASDYAKKNEDLRGLTSALDTIMICYQILKKSQESLEIAFEILELEKKIGNNQEIARGYLIISNAQRANKNYDEEEKNVRIAESLMQNLSIDNELKFRLALNLTYVSLHKNRKKEALNYFKESKELIGNNKKYVEEISYLEQEISKMPENNKNNN